MHRFLHPRWHCPASQLAWQSSWAASVHSLSPQEEFTHNKPPSSKFLKFIRTTCNSEQVLLPNFCFVLGVWSNWSWQDCWTIVILCSVYMISAEGDHSKSCLGVMWKCHGDTSTAFPSMTFEWSPSHWACVVLQRWCGSQPDWIEVVAGMAVCAQCSAREMLTVQPKSTAHQCWVLDNTLKSRCRQDDWLAERPHGRPTVD